MNQGVESRTKYDLYEAQIAHFLFQLCQSGVVFGEVHLLQ